MTTWTLDLSDGDIAAIAVLSDAWLAHAGALIGTDNDEAERIMLASNALIAALMRMQPVGMEATT